MADPQHAGGEMDPTVECDRLRQCHAASRRRDWEMLLISIFVLVMAMLLRVQPDQRVSIRGLGRLPLPGLCFSREFFHVSCPGCGLTRSIVFLAAGDLAGSIRMHRLGWLMALSILAQIPYRILCLRHPRPPTENRPDHTEVGPPWACLRVIDGTARSKEQGKGTGSRADECR